MAKNMVKAPDIRLKTDKELETRLADLRKEQFNLRFQKATGQLPSTARVTHVRKEIAKIMSITGERQRANNNNKTVAKVAKPAAKKPARKAASAKSAQEG